MYEDKTFENIMAAMLDRVAENVDKREGSIIYDALAPVAMDLAETYAYMDLLIQRSFADSADGEDLTRRVAEHGVYRYLATASVRKVEITVPTGAPHDSVPVGTVFSLNSLQYTITKKTAPGKYRAVASEPGAKGNTDFGEMVPIEPVVQLGLASLSEVLIPGEDEESDEALYARYLRHINEQPFGGNRADYKDKALSLPGVGGVRLFRTPAKGGTVGLLLIDSSYSAPSEDLITQVKTVFDPDKGEGEGEGSGLAPIGHTVIVTGVKDLKVNITADLTLNGVSVGQIEPVVKEKIEEYLLSLRKQWALDQTVTVRISHIETRLIDIQGIEDIRNTTINGVADNLSVADTLIPVLGGVVLSEI